MISWNTIRLTGTLGFSTSSRCQAIASPSRSSSVASRSSVGALQLSLQLVDLLLLVGIDDVERLEVVVDVDAEARPGSFFSAAGMSAARFGRSRMWPIEDSTT